MIYTKPALDIKNQISLLKLRGLIIKDETFAEKTLKERISYYRLAGYWWSFRSDKVNHIFKPNSKFETVIKVYEFDSELRTLLFDTIEQIEIALRCKMNYYLSLEKGPWWFEDSATFKDSKIFRSISSTVSVQLTNGFQSEVFLKEHKEKYHTDTRKPPSWKTLEVLSLGCLSKIYGGLANNLAAKDQIASDFGTVNHTYLSTWLQSITQIRNICAHHGRLWNKNLPSTVKLLPKPPLPWLKDVPQPNEFIMLYVHLSCMKYLLNTINPTNNFTYRLDSLLRKYPNIDPNALGLKKNRRKEPVWNNKINSELLRFVLFYHKGIFLIKNALK